MVSSKLGCQKFSDQLDTVGTRKKVLGADTFPVYCSTQALIQIEPELSLSEPYNCNPTTLLYGTQVSCLFSQS